MLVKLPGIGRSIDSLVTEACASLGIEPWGGPSENGWSKHADFLRCPYRYYLKHVKGMGPLHVGDPGSALDIGSFTHLMLAAHYARMLPDERYPGWRANSPEPLVLLAALKKAGLSLSIAADVERLYEGYAEYYGNETIQPVAVEMPAGLRGTHTSRFDLVFYVEDGLHDGLWIGEHKTASPAADLDDFRYNGEILGEMLSFQLSGLQDFFGQRLNGVCINALVKSKTPRYQRLWLTFPDQLINDFASTRGEWAQREIDCVRRNKWPRSMFGCVAYFRKCRFWEHCRTQDDALLVSLPPR